MLLCFAWTGPLGDPRPLGTTPSSLRNVQIRLFHWPMNNSMGTGNCNNAEICSRLSFFSIASLINFSETSFVTNTADMSKNLRYFLNCFLQLWKIISSRFLSTSLLLTISQKSKLNGSMCKIWIKMSKLQVSYVR